MFSEIGYRMMYNQKDELKVIAMVGTSLLFNFNRSCKEKELKVIIEEMGKIDQRGGAANDNWSSFDSDDVSYAKETILKWACEADNFSMLSAEINSLQKIGETTSSRLEVYLLASDTMLSRLAAEIILDFMECKENKEKLSLTGSKVYFDPAIHLIKGLQVSNPEMLEIQGLEGLLSFIDQVCGKDYENAAFNITGGFKGLIPYMTLIAQSFRLPVYYIYENSDHLIKMPLLPFEFDFSLLDENYLAFEGLRPTILSKGKAYEESTFIKTRPYKDFLNDISKDSTEASRELERLVEANLIYIIETTDSEPNKKGKQVGLTALGRILFKRYEQLFNKREYHRANLFSGLVELKLFYYLYEKRFNYEARVRNGVKHHTKEGKQCEIDLLVEDNQGGVILAEVKLFGNSVPRFYDVVGKIDKKLNNEALKDYINVNGYRIIEYQIYLVSHKALREEFVNIIMTYMNSNRQGIDCKLSWYLVKLDPSYKKSFTWTIEDDNLSRIELT
jgi:putative CRISPR-associated protein (TIGR02619 family)